MAHFRLRLSTLLFLIQSLILFGNGNSDNQRLDIHRFDKAIQLVNFKDNQEVQTLLTEFKLVIDSFLRPLATDSAASLNDQLETFANLNNIKFFFSATNRKFADTDTLRQVLSDVKRRYEETTSNVFPSIFTVISPYNQSIMMLDSANVAIALNHYLGADYPPYSYYPAYIRTFKVPEKIIYNLVEALLKTKYPFTPESNSLLEHMLYEGAVACAAASIIPQFDESAYFSFTPEQTAWMKLHETDIKNLPFFTNDLQSSAPDLLRSMVGAAPFSAPVSPQSPGGAGRWIGMRIMVAYLSANPSDPIAFLQNSIYQNSIKILKKSGYDKK